MLARWGLLGKTLLTKKAHEQGLMTGSSCQAGWGKMAQH
jgi:hypothetical protein